MLLGMPSRVRRVKLFRDGRNQALRIPREFELEGTEALVHRDGDTLVVQPVRTGKLLTLLSKLEPLDETFPDVDDRLATPRASRRV
jgi:antitoxin VapB